MGWHVSGIDISLSNTGVATMHEGSRWPIVVNITSGASPKTERGGDLEPGVSLLARRDRIQHLAARIVNAATRGYEPDVDDAPLFVVEAPLYRAPMKRDPKSGEMMPLVGGGHAHDRAWLWGLTVHALFKQGFVVEVSTTTMKRYATGSGGTRKGQDSKAGVLEYVIRNFPELPTPDNNGADALALLAMGARQLGHPLEPSVQRVTPAALNKVAWPTETQRRNRT